MTEHDRAAAGRDGAWEQRRWLWEPAEQNLAHEGYCYGWEDSLAQLRATAPNGEPVEPTPDQLRAIVHDPEVASRFHPTDHAYALARLAYQRGQESVRATDAAGLREAVREFLTLLDGTIYIPDDQARAGIASARARLNAALESAPSATDAAGAALLRAVEEAIDAHSDWVIEATEDQAVRLGRAMLNLNGAWTALVQVDAPRGEGFGVRGH